MKRLGLLAIPLLCLSTPAGSADLYGPVYRERDVVIERPAPPRVIERERIVERHYYYPPAPAYAERRIYSEPRVYHHSPAYEDAYYVRPYSHAYTGWRRTISSHGGPTGMGVVTTTGEHSRWVEGDEHGQSSRPHPSVAEIAARDGK